MRYFAAWVVGALVYLLVAAGSGSFDGSLSLIGQPIVAGLVSAVFVLGAFLLGLPLRLPPVRSLWHGRALGVLLASGLAASGVALLIFCLSTSQIIEQVHPEAEKHFLVTRSLGLYASAYLALIFSVANWPDSRLCRPASA